MTTSAAEQTASRVFVSYSHDSRVHEDRVLALADRLREDGIDAVLDQYDTAPPDGWPMWMDREIQKADFVALVCTDVYRRRVEGREEPLKGRGVLWEAKLIYNHLYQTDTAVQRFIPILMEGESPSCMPWPVRGLSYYSIDTPEGYESLYRHLTRQPRHERPVLGSVKALPAISPNSYPASLDFSTEAPPTTNLSRRNRKQMLKRVRLDWIEGVLNQSLYKIARVELDLESKADAVEQPLNAIVQIPHRAPVPVLAGTDISQIFDAHAGSLLILGEPGTGKTTLLLELARALLNRAEKDENYPIPVVFQLSSWALRRQPLAEWLVAELNERSDVPKRVARRWVDTEQIIPLLDGLDEVALDHRQACVEALNHFRRGHGLLPIAVCSRIADYEALGKKLRLQSAIVVRPLTRTQVNEYLRQGEEPLRRLRTALDEDASLWALLETPLMLWVAMLGYQHGPAERSQDCSIEERRGRLIAGFVDAMFARRSADIPYTREQTVRWLSSLATGLTRNRETVFQLENLGPHWPSTRAQRWLCRAGTVVASGVIGGPVLGLIHGLITWFMVILLTLPQASLSRTLALLSLTSRFGLEWALSWLSPALCFGFAGAFLKLRPTETIRITMTGVASRWGRAIRAGLVLGVTVWLGLCPVALWFVGDGHHLMEEPIIRELLTLSPFAAGLFKSSVIRLLAMNLGIGLIVVPLAALAGLIAGLVVLVCGKAVEARTKPNQGTRRSVRSAVISLLTLGLSGSLIGILTSGTLFKPGSTFDAAGLVLGLDYGLSCGMIVGMVAGGLFSLRHFVLRLVLWITGLAPLNYVRFLDHAKERLFLRKTGGGYIFIHRVVLEYFASLAERDTSQRP